MLLHLKTTLCANWNSRTETLLKEDQPSFNIPANSTLAAVVDPSPLRSGLKCYHQSVRAVGLWGMGRYCCCSSGNSTVGTGFGLRNPPCSPLTRERGWKHVILYNCAELGLTWPFWECIGGNNTFTKNPGVMRQDSIRGTSGPDIWTTLIKILKKRMFPVPVKLAVAGINDIFNVRWSDINEYIFKSESLWRWGTARAWTFFVRFLLLQVFFAVNGGGSACNYFLQTHFSKIRQQSLRLGLDGGREDECFMHFPSLPMWHFSALANSMLTS